MADGGRGGANFFRENTTISAKDMQELNKVAESVGLIEIERSEEGQVKFERGTGFLISSGYFMTAYHVFENKIDDVLQDLGRFLCRGERFLEWFEEYLPGSDLPELEAITKCLETKKTLTFESFKNFMGNQDYDELTERLKEKWCDKCHVTFHGNNSPFFFCPLIPFADKTHDVIILKIDTTRQLPKSLQLAAKYEKRDRVSLYGYIKQDGKEELHLDPQCKIYVSDDQLDTDIGEALRWWQDKEHQLDQEDKNHSYKDTKVNFVEDFKKCSAAYSSKCGCVTLHASDKFVEGTSGSPVIFIKRVGEERKPVVTAMYLRGYPSLYYKIQHSISSHNPLPSSLTHYNKFRDLVKSNEHIPLKYFFEAGITMERVAQILGQFCPDLSQQILGNRGHQGTETDMEMDQIPSMTSMPDPAGGRFGKMSSQTDVRPSRCTDPQRPSTFTTQASVPVVDGPTDGTSHDNMYEEDAEPERGSGFQTTEQIIFTPGGKKVHRIHHQHGDGSHTTIQYDKHSNANIQVGNNNQMIINQRGKSRPAKETKNIVVKDSDLSKSTEPVTQSHMDKVASSIGKKWKRLARQLEIPNAKIEQIEMDFEREGTYEVIYQILKEWKKRKGTAATVGFLVTKLLSIERGDIVRELEACGNP